MGETNADGPDLFVSNSTINSFQSALTDYYKQKRLQMDPATLLSLSDFSHGYRQKIGNLMQSGKMLLIEGTGHFRWISFPGIKCSQGNWWFQMQYICSFNLTDLLESNVRITYVHISWVGDAMKITTPTHKGDQEGANTQPRYLYANPLTPSICSVLSLTVFIFSQSLTRSENENNESRFGKWLALSIKSQDSNSITVRRPYRCRFQFYDY